MPKFQTSPGSGRLRLARAVSSSLRFAGVSFAETRGGTATATFRVVVAGLCLAVAPLQAKESAAAHVQFIEEPAGNCVSRGGVQILVKSNHASRRIRVWLDRTVGGSGTGDRSRSELAPGAAAEPLGCSRNSDLAQGWRLVRAEFVD